MHIIHTDTPRLFRAAIIFFFMLICLTKASPTGTTRVTNAERFAKGLPPAVPQGFIKRNIGGVVRFVPGQRRETVPRTIPSAAPAVSYSGSIKVIRRTSGEVLGFIGKRFDKERLYTLAASKSRRLIVQFTTASGAPFEIKAQNNPKTDYPYLGFAVGSADNFRVTSLLVGINAGNSTSQEDQDRDGEVEETDVWTFNPSTYHLSPIWASSDASNTTLTLFHSELGYFGLTNDLNKLMRETGNVADEVVSMITVTMIL
ncbi:hypothetical protein FRC03_000918 [Tulasnella sp. 419]|nr:hypothetical protein FRC03_000918 [Tulasnella sp. 419]